MEFNRRPAIPWESMPQHGPQKVQTMWIDVTKSMSRIEPFGPPAWAPKGSDELGGLAIASGIAIVSLILLPVWVSFTSPLFGSSVDADIDALSYGR